MIRATPEPTTETSRQLPDWLAQCPYAATFQHHVEQLCVPLGLTALWVVPSTPAASAPLHLTLALTPPHQQQGVAQLTFSTATTPPPQAIVQCLQISLQQQLNLLHTQHLANAQAQRWRHALYNTFGIWDWQLPDDQLKFSEQWLQLIGLNQWPDKKLRHLFKRIHPQDRTGFKHSLRQLIDGAIDQLDCETRIQHQEGYYVWLRNRGRVTDRNHTGALRIVGTSVNIQKRKTGEEEIYDLCQQLQASETRYRELMKNASDAILIIDLESLRVIDANYQATHLSGYNLKELFTKKHSELIFNPDGECRCYDGGLHRDMILVDKHGHHHTVDVGCTRIDLSGRQLLQCIIHDISERKATEEHLHHLAHHDPLTGLPNRILFRDRLQQAILKADRHNTLVALCFFDLDNFKQINDNFGHDGGDQVLIDIANRLKQGIRASDTAARLGGDEFVIILEAIENPTVIQTIATKVLEQINRPIHLDKQRVQVTSSLGISIYPKTSRDLDTLINHADTAMYSAKEVGNCLEFFRCCRPEPTNEEKNLELWPEP